jgi:hypothetical protein
MSAKLPFTPYQYGTSLSFWQAAKGSILFCIVTHPMSLNSYVYQ